MFFTPRRKRAMLLAAMLLGLLYHFTTDSASSDLGSFYKSTTRAMNRGFHRGDGKLQEPEPEQKHLQPDSSPGVVRGGDRVHVHGMGEGQAQDAEFRKITLNEVGEQDRQAAHPDRELELHKERKAKEKANKEGKKGSSDGAAVDDSSGAKQPEPPVDEKEAKLRKQPGPGSGKTNGEPEKKTPERAVADELKDIFNRAPVTVFSKTYCPFSKKAKHILKKYYTMNPPPTIVDLDEHQYGPQLQKVLSEMTGRKTVPNILVNHKSLGGSDELAQLHEDGKLLETIRTMVRGTKKFEIDLLPAGKG